MELIGFIKRNRNGRYRAVVGSLKDIDNDGDPVVWFLSESDLYEADDLESAIEDLRTTVTQNEIPKVSYVPVQAASFYVESQFELET